MLTPRLARVQNAKRVGVSRIPLAERLAEMKNVLVAVAGNIKSAMSLRLLNSLLGNCFISSLWSNYLFGPVIIGVLVLIFINGGSFPHK